MIAMQKYGSCQAAAEKDELDVKDEAWDWVRRISKVESGSCSQEDHMKD